MNGKPKLTPQRRLGRLGLENEFLSPVTRDRSVTRDQNNFLSVNLPVYKIVRVLPLLFTSEYCKENLTSHITFSRKLGKCSFYVVVLQMVAEKPTRLYFARAVSLFCSLTLHDTAVVVFLNSLLSLLFGEVLHDVAVVAF